jgi:hypothetical protein
MAQLLQSQTMTNETNEIRKTAVLICSQEHTFITYFEILWWQFDWSDSA